MTLLSQFLSYMGSHNLSPHRASDIIPDNKRRNYRLASDKAGKKSGFYKLHIEGDFGYAFFGDYRYGESISWYASADKKYTARERREYARRAEEARAVAEVEQIALWNTKAKEVQEYILFLSDCPDEHPYLKKKGIKAHGVLLDADKIVIPMGNKDGVWSYQSITFDGAKKFPYQAKKTGTYFEIKGSGAIFIAEGYATAATIHEATGGAVYVAFDAGNLLPVAKEVRALNPDAQITICADNDAFGKINVGMEKGRKAAIEINALFIYPEFKDISEKPTDFNDLAALEGIQAVKDRIGEAQKPKPDSEAPAVLAPAQDVKSHHGGGGATNDEWQLSLVVNKKGELISTSPTNLNLYMRNHPAVKGVFRYDSFAKRIIIPRCPPWEDESSFNVRPIHDYDYFRLECFLETEFSLKVNKNRCADSIESTAQLPEYAFNPASDYFNTLVWDGVPRLDSWLQRYVCDGKQPDEYLRMVGRKFVCGLAARAMSPGVKFDTMIILEGKQYAGKSFLSRVLATINGEEYFLDDFKEIDNKDALMKIQGKLVVEFPEISTMRRAEVNDLKAFLSRTHDVYRPPYGRNTVEAPRQCVFVGTINPEGPYLRDVTGNRRYWPVSCRDDIDIKSIRDIVTQLHAEAAHYVKMGEKLWMNKEEYELASIEQDKRVVSDIWIDAIQEIVALKDEITTDELLQSLEIPKERRTPQTQSRIAQTMTALGWEHSRLARGNKRPRGYIKRKSEKGETESLFVEDIKW